jgi:hypothetical protein
MTAVGHVQGEGAVLGLSSVRRARREVQIPSLVVRGVGVGDVVGQDFGTLGAKAQGFSWIPSALSKLMLMSGNLQVTCFSLTGFSKAHANV